ncbi:hypothetical protein QWY99_01120 [Flavobacterium branchiarum]|uniref:Uncharacterized protein n=1 Tax=Flavobacterium branchiarum TaxID=1114870 RepID=A0ABV5FQX7_9FLAO|nr:hypothetical protein [Flavobacterium branchiarum]MDN3671666.1 hypothetical protein [Flavobacterium branchiarum]
MNGTITIIPVEDHQQYNVNGHTVYKDSNDNFVSKTDMSDSELRAFRKYKQLVIDNPRFKTHTKATYKV